MTAPTISAPPRNSAAVSGSVLRLVRHGFVQGERAGKQAGECATCDKTVTRNRSWYWRTSYEYDEWDCYCKRCALQKVESDIAAWNAIPLPNSQNQPREASV